MKRNHHLHATFAPAQLLTLADTFTRFERRLRAQSRTCSTASSEALLCVAEVFEDMAIELTASAAESEK